jgi:sugar O-acyltransferase (sialic acid O-acetyltransferase NeuD family)
VLRAQDRSVMGYTSPGSTTLDLDYLGRDDDFFTSHITRVEVLVAVGDNRSRLALLRKLTTNGFAAAVAIHPSSVVSPSSQVGPGAVLMAGTVVNARSVIGSGAIINTGATVDHDCHLGDAVHIAPGAHLAGAVTIGEGTFLGVGVAVIPNCTIGDWAMVGAGAAVVSDLVGGYTYVGVPARPLSGHVEEPASIADA